MHRRPGLYIGPQGLDGKGDAGNQTAAADGHNDRIQVIHLVEDLQTDGALSGDDVFIIKGMDKGVAVFLLQLQSLPVGIIVHTGYQTNLGTEALGGFHLGKRGIFRQADQRRDAALGSCQSNALGMVACGTGNNTLGLFFFAEHGNLVTGTAELKRAGSLKVFRLEIQLEILGKTVGSCQRRGTDYIFQNQGGVENLVNGQHMYISFQKGICGACKNYTIERNTSQATADPREK